LPPDLDIYCLTKLRDAETINLFFDRYIDRIQNEDRGDEELMILKIDADPDSEESQNYEWEPAITLSHAITRGLDRPRRCFTLYLKSQKTEFSRVILSFTTDDKMILGLCIDDAGAKPKNLARAKELLSMMVEEFGGYRGLILVEDPPPDNEEVFQQISEDSHPLCLYSWTRHDK
jgi:hypothetical protein